MGLWRVSDHKPSPLCEAPRQRHKTIQNQSQFNALSTNLCFQLRCYEHYHHYYYGEGNEKKVSGSGCGGNVERAVKARGGRLACKIKFRPPSLRTNS
jgi:hypothetical protein